MMADLNPRSTFDTYVIGRENGLAAAASRAVAETPGSVYNPLCITGGPGLGKTHLLMAIAHTIENANSRYSVEYFTPDGLSEAYNAAVSAGQGETFRRRLSETDVLLIDDMHALARQPDMQAELLRVTGELHAAGKQIVVVSHVPPIDLEGVDAGFVARISEGLVVSVGPPEYETRLAILKRRSDERGSFFEEGVLDAVASYDIEDVRELIGVLNRLVALQALSETPLTAEAARAMYDGELASAAAMGQRKRSGADEFQDFLSGVSDVVRRQVDLWESRLTELSKHWAEKGFCTDRLASVTSTSSAKSVGAFLEEFERDVRELEVLRGSVSAKDPSLSDSPAFFDPDRLAEARDIAQRVVAEPQPLPGPSKAWRFEGFIGSWANAVAVEAAKAVAAYPGYEHNPLVIVGATGVGKTHLLNATGNAIAEVVGVGVVCIPAESLVESFRQAEQSGLLDEWRAEISGARALLIDDIHLIAGDERLQREVGMLLANVRDARRQVACSLNAHPNDVAGFDHALVSLLTSGYIGSLASPDRELRSGIVKRILRNRVGTVDSALADYLADRPADSLRAVTGVVERVLDAADSRGVAATAALARELIEGTEPDPSRRTPGARTSGVLVTPASSVRSTEKMIWVWPDPSERLIEELS